MMIIIVILTGVIAVWSFIYINYKKKGVNKLTNNLKKYEKKKTK